MGKESLIDENTSIALEKVTQKSHELIQSIDKSIFYYLQSLTLINSIILK